METLLDVERDHGAVVDARLLAVAQTEHEETEEHGGEDLHLSVRELLPQAYPRTSLHMEEASGHVSDSVRIGDGLLWCMDE